MGKSKAAKPTRSQKTLISGTGLVAGNWLVPWETSKELRLVSRGAGATRIIKKDQCGGNRRRSK